MPSQGQNQGFLLIDEFICEAIPDPGVPQAPPARQGRNEGMGVFDEVIVEAASGGSDDDTDSPCS